MIFCTNPLLKESRVNVILIDINRTSMMDTFNQDGSTIDPSTKNLQRKLYVAYLNEAMMDNCSASKHAPIVFSSTGGSYYINGIPAILSQDEEMMLYGGEETPDYYH